MMACESYRPARDQVPSSSYRVVNSVESDFEVELTAPAIIETVSVPAGSHVVFDRANLKAIVVKEPWTFLGHKYPEGTRFDFSYGGYYEGTQLRKVTLGGRDSSGPNTFQAVIW